MKSFNKRKALKVTFNNHHKHQEALKDINKETKAKYRRSPHAAGVNLKQEKGHETQKMAS